MPLVGAQDLFRSYNDRKVLSGVSVTIEPGERVGLVGVNGCGKTTLARILAGSEEPDAGDVSRARGLTLGYLGQEPEMDPGASALDVALGGCDLRHEAEAMLDRLGVTRPERAVGTLSGGERRRVAIARVLVARPDFAILDEPTNHLDIPTIEWLEEYLVERFSGALLLITHDRALLDRVVGRTLELDRGELYSYDGGWEAFLIGHAERLALAERVEANRKNFLRRELEWLRRKPSARTTKQKARVDRAEAAIERGGPAREGGTARIEVGEIRSGKSVLELRELAVDIAGARVVDGLTLAVGAGERIGVVGPNGIGKTTLIRALLGELPPAAGTVVRGKNTKIAYLDQARAGLEDTETVFDSIAQGQQAVMLGGHEMEMRSYVQRFLFDSAAQKQLVGTLSGGERARVALARVLRDGANLVVLDEPTNDLDVATLGALEASLLDFGGTALVVTHDRWFLERVATSILAFEGTGRVVHVAGNYSDYKAWHDAQAAAAPAREPAPTRKADPRPPRAKRGLTYGERLELEGLMAKIEAAESEVAAMNAILEDPAFSDRHHTDQAAFVAELAAARARAEALVERWSELESRKD